MLEEFGGLLTVEGIQRRVRGYIDSMTSIIERREKRLEKLNVEIDGLQKYESKLREEYNFAKNIVKTLSKYTKEKDDGKEK